jgi:hypothetical protein
MQLYCSYAKFCMYQTLVPCKMNNIIVHKNKLIQANTYRYTVRLRLQRSENTTELAAL